METTKLINLNEAIPFKATHPGEVLSDELKARGLKQKDFAGRIGMSPAHLNELIKGKRNVTLDIAVRLEKELGIPYGTWMSLQNNYDYNTRAIAQRDDEESKAAREEATLSELLNLKEMYKRLGITCKSVAGRIKSLRETLRCDPLDTARFESRTFGLFKRSDKLDIDEKNLRTWIVLARSAAIGATMDGYRKGCAVEAAREIASMANQQTLSVDAIKHCLSSHGIAYVEVPKLERTPVDAYSTMFDGKPAIAVTYRHDDMDKLAFDILHELCHIDRHLADDGRDSFINMDGSIYSDNPYEQQANQFAQDALIPPAIWDDMVSCSSKSISPYAVAKRIADEASKRGISKTIAVARYKHDTNIYDIRQYRSPKIRR